MNLQFPNSQHKRALYIVDLAWHIFFERVASGKIIVNKESSLQLHYATVLHTIGEAFCILPNETFTIELESAHGRKNIDITFSLGETKGAIELKCFRKASNRAVDVDMYDVLKDVERLSSFNEYQIRKFICLTDNKYYSEAAHKGHAGSVTIKEGKTYEKGVSITPTWVGKWKDRTRDAAIKIGIDVKFRWIKKKEWYAFTMNM